MSRDDQDLLLEHMTWQEAKAAQEAGRVLIIPIGAIEAHGPHLPLATDAIVAFELARRVARRHGAVVAPAMCYTARSSPRSGGGGRNFAGSTGLTCSHQLTRIALQVCRYGSIASVSAS